MGWDGGWGFTFLKAPPPTKNRLNPTTNKLKLKNKAGTHIKTKCSDMGTQKKPSMKNEYVGTHLA